MTVVMIEHDMGVVMDLSHRLMVLDFGRKIAEGLAGGDQGEHGREARLPRRGPRCYRHPSRHRGHAMSSARFAHVAANDTLPKLLRYNARQHGADIALREKEFGLWKSYTWSDFHERTKLWALALRSLGVGQGDTVAIIGDSRPDWIAAAIATHAVRAKSLGLYQDGLDTEVGYLIAYAEAKVVIAEDEEQVDKMLRVTAGIPSVQKIVYCDPRGMRKYDRSQAGRARRAARGRAQDRRC